MDHVDRLPLRHHRPALFHDHPVLRVDGDGQSVGEAVDEAHDEIGIVERRGADDDARDAGLDELLRGVIVADAAPSLDRHREAAAKRAQDIQVRRRSGPRAVEIDHVQPFRALVDPAACRFHRRWRDFVRRGVVAGAHADSLPVKDVDGGIDDHRSPVPRTKPSSSRSPMRELFSGWNCTPSNPLPPTIAGMSEPYSVVASTTSSSGSATYECTK